MTEQEKASPAEASRSVWVTSFEGAFSVSSFVLSLQALAPMHGSLPWQTWYGVIATVPALFGLAGGLLMALRDARVELRVCALAAWAGILYLIAQIDGWAVSSPGRLTSAVTASLSLSVRGLPFVALLMAFAILATGVVQFGFTQRLFTAHLMTRRMARSAQQDIGTSNTVATRSMSILLSATVTLFSCLLWLRALLGYASGSPNLFIQ